MGRTKHFRYKLYFHPTLERPLAVDITAKNAQGVTTKLGDAIIIADPDNPLPPLPPGESGKFEERLAELIVHPKDEKRKGEVTLRKEKGRHGR